MQIWKNHLQKLILQMILWYDGHAVSLWWKSTQGVVADEPDSDSQGLYREVQARRRDSEIVAWRTET